MIENIQYIEHHYVVGLQLKVRPPRKIKRPSNTLHLSLPCSLFAETPPDVRALSTPPRRPARSAIATLTSDRCICVHRSLRCDVHVDSIHLNSFSNTRNQ